MDLKITAFLAAIFAATCLSQPYTVSMSMEPLDILKAVFQSQLKQVALYEVVICSGPSEVAIPGGRIMQAANAKGVQTIDKRLLSIAMNTGRRKSKLYRVYKVAYYAGWAGSLLTVGGTIAASRGVQVGLLLATQGAGELKSAMETRNNDADLLIPGFLDVKDQIALRPNACEGRLLLGMYSRDFKPFVVESGQP